MCIATTCIRNRGIIGMKKILSAGAVALARGRFVAAIRRLADDFGYVEQGQTASIDIARIHSVLRLNAEQEALLGSGRSALRNIARQQQAHAEQGGFIRRDQSSRGFDCARQRRRRTAGDCGAAVDRRAERRAEAGGERACAGDGLRPRGHGGAEIASRAPRRVRSQPLCRVAGARHFFSQPGLFAALLRCQSWLADICESMRL